MHMVQMREAQHTRPRCTKSSAHSPLACEPIGHGPKYGPITNFFYLSAPFDGSPNNKDMICIKNRRKLLEDFVVIIYFIFFIWFFKVSCNLNI